MNFVKAFFDESCRQLSNIIFFWRSRADPEPGDLIEIFRMRYEHWAVYVGSGYVVHLAPPDGFSGLASSVSVLANRAVVKKELLSDVVGSDRYHINNKHDSTYTVRHPDEIVSLAESLVGLTMEYDLVKWNCEHFVNLLRYDVAQSDQVRNIILLGLAALLLVVLP